MVVIAQRDEPEWLQRSLAGSTHRAEHFGHASNRTTLYMESNLDEVALAQRSGKPQQAAGNRNSLQLCLGTLTVFQHDQCRHRTAQVNTRRATLRMRLGEVSHRHPTIPWG